LDAPELSWVHFGDLHITDDTQANYRDFLEIIDVVNTHLVPHIDFCVLPGDVADDGTADQYQLVRRGLDRLQRPVHIIPGDHDRKPGSLDAFYQTLGAARLPDAVALSWRMTGPRSLQPLDPRDRSRKDPWGSPSSRFVVGW